VRAGIGRSHSRQPLRKRLALKSALKKISAQIIQPTVIKISVFLTGMGTYTGVLVSGLLSNQQWSKFTNDPAEIRYENLGFWVAAEKLWPTLIKTLH